MQVTHRVATIIGIAVGSLTAGVYLIGSGRAFDYDSAATVETFIRTGSLADPFRRQIAFNNHPLFSFLEHVVYTLTGSASEWAMRPLPILFAAATVGLLVGTLAARRSLWIGLAAGVLLTLNPLFISETRAVRGYSLLCLCAVGSSLLLDRLDRTGRGRLVYALVVAIGVATHLYMLGVVIGHIAWIASRKRLSRSWALTWVEGVLFGSFAYLGLMQVMTESSRRLFRPTFPYDLARALLGHNPILVAVELAGVIAAIWTWRDKRETWFVGAAVALLVLGAWLVAPQFLFPRFFVWLLPGVVTLAAIGLARVRLLPLAALVVVVLPGAAHSFTRDPIANRAAAVAIQPLIRDGLKVCTFGLDYGGISVYTTDLKPIYSPDDLKRCDATVSILSNDATQQLIETNVTQFPFVTMLPAEMPGVIRSRTRLDAAVLSYRLVEQPFPATLTVSR